MKSKTAKDIFAGIGFRQWKRIRGYAVLYSLSGDVVCSGDGVTHDEAKQLDVLLCVKSGVTILDEGIGTGVSRSTFNSNEPVEFYPDK